MNEDAINDPRYGGREQREESKEREKSQPLSFLKNYFGRKLSKKIGLQITKQAMFTAIRAAGSNPWGLVIILLVIFFLILLYMFFGYSREGSTKTEDVVTQIPIGGGSQGPKVPGLSVTKTGLSRVENGENIVYSISVTYDEFIGNTPASNIILTDKLPTTVEFVSATGSFLQNGNTIEWPLTAGVSSYNFSLVVKPNQNDIEVSNTIYGRSLIAPSKLIDSSASNLSAIFNDAARIANVPLAILKAIAKTESEVLGYSSSEVTQFNSSLWWSGLTDNAPNLSDNHPLIKRGHAYNTCQYLSCASGSDVRGAMQVELATWNSLKPQLSFADGHESDRRYVRDSIYAAAYFIRDKIDLYDDRFNFTNNLSSLDEAQVKALARSYCGGNPDADTNQPACGEGRHEANVWAYYQEYNN